MWDFQNQNEPVAFKVKIINIFLGRNFPKLAIVEVLTEHRKTTIVPSIYDVDMKSSHYKITRKNYSTVYLGIHVRNSWVFFQD